MTTFSSILDKNADEIERPKPLPQGTYLCVVDGQPTQGKSAKKQTDFIEFNLKPMQALDDVNEEALTASLTSGDGSVKALADKRIRATYYDTPDAGWRLVKFLRDCGLETKGKKVSRLVSEAQNCQVLAYIKHVPSDDGTAIFAQLGSTAPVVEE